MTIPTPYLLAAGLTAVVAGWMLSGDIVTGGREDATPETVSERNQKAEQTLFKVQTNVFEAKSRTALIDVRGSTEASGKVSVRAETTGLLLKRHVNKGDTVKAGDLICSLKTGDREALVSQRAAELKSAQIELNAAKKLATDGYATQYRVVENQASLDAAIAQMKSAEIELERVEIRSPVEGLVQDPFAKVGDMLQVGDICANVMDPQSIVMTAQVSERYIGRMAIGSKANVRVVTGEQVEGTIKFIAPSADTETRTFRIEIALPNDDAKIRDGITAVASIVLPGDTSHLLPASVLTLNDAGEIGVKMIKNPNIVAFTPVKILEDTREGVWVAGLPASANLIIRGHEYVSNGQKVDPVTKTAEVN